MNELSIEEKARRYDEAIEKAKTFYKNANGMILLKKWVEQVFPELKESEDERIRKDIISYLKSSTAISPKTWIAWLEKQGKHAKFCDSIQVGDKVTRNKDGVLVNLSQLKRVAKKDEKQGEQNPTNNQFTTEQVSILDKHIDKFLEQKSIWSEKDEKMIQYIINDIAIRQEQVYCKSRCEDEINWLKSLKDKYIWKPSVEQMNALDSTFQYSQVSHNSFEHLNSLFNDLKKLREE